jgi:hypothetical protein
MPRQEGVKFCQYTTFFGEILIYFGTNENYGSFMVRDCTKRGVISSIMKEIG